MSESTRQPSSPCFQCFQKRLHIKLGKGRSNGFIRVLMCVIPSRHNQKRRDRERDVVTHRSVIREPHIEMRHMLSCNGPMATTRSMRRFRPGPVAGRICPLAASSRDRIAPAARASPKTASVGSRLKSPATMKGRRQELHEARTSAAQAHSIKGNNSNLYNKIKEARCTPVCSKALGELKGSKRNLTDQSDPADTSDVGRRQGRPETPILPSFQEAWGRRRVDVCFSNGTQLQMVAAHKVGNDISRRNRLVGPSGVCRSCLMLRVVMESTRLCALLLARSLLHNPLLP